MDFAPKIIAWQRTSGRHDLPWQGQDAYRVWVSEIMLQQTQVATVIPYYLRFIRSFPDVASLACASEEQVLAHWSGLGYYARGRNLHRAAQEVMQHHGGEFPRDFAKLIELPGIGRSTAAAICALACHERQAILDGNVKRILARYAGIDGWSGETKVAQQLWLKAEELLPQQDTARYTQGLMDLGALVCTRSRPCCAVCPVQSGCIAYLTARVSAIPAPRPRKPVPERHASFLLLLHRDEILLEKRPGHGIWGGLWCPPQTGGGPQEEELYLQQRGLRVHERTELPQFTHAFTHFRLQISPVLLYLQDRPVHCAEPGRQWLNVAAAGSAAMPAPVRKVLLGLASRGNP